MARRHATHGAEALREVALAAEAAGERDLDKPNLGHRHQPFRALDATAQDNAVRGFARGALELLDHTGIQMLGVRRHDRDIAVLLDAQFVSFTE